MRIPRHVGFIPDGNRRWAEQRGLPKSAGYAAGIQPGFDLLDLCRQLSIPEVSIYGFTQENTHRPKEQTEAYRSACVEFGLGVMTRGYSLYVLGEANSSLFPPELKPFTTPPDSRESVNGPKVNLLVNYNWEWDLQTGISSHSRTDEAASGVAARLASASVSRIDLIVRWGGRRRLSGFLPVQSVYADFYVEEAFWPDYTPEQFVAVLRWYARQDVTLGG